MPALGLALGLGFGGGKSAAAPPSNNTNLSSFIIEGIAVSDGDTIQQPFGATDVGVTAIPEDPAATVEVSGNTGLATGDNVVSVLVTAADGVTQRTYHVTVHVLTQALQEITTFTGFFDAGGVASPGSDAKYIRIGIESNQSYVFWANTGQFESAPTVPGVGNIYRQVGIGMEFSAKDVRDAVISMINSEAGVQLTAEAGATDTDMIVTSNAPGVRESALNGGLCSSFTITQTGATPV